MPLEIVGKIATRRSKSICALAVRSKTDYAKASCWTPPSAYTSWIVLAISSKLGNVIVFESNVRDDVIAAMSALSKQLEMVQFNTSFAARVDDIDDIMPIVSFDNGKEYTYPEQNPWDVVVKMANIDELVVTAGARTFAGAANIIAHFMDIINRDASKAEKVLIGDEAATAQ